MISHSEIGSLVLGWIAIASLVIEMIAVTIIVYVVLASTFKYFFSAARNHGTTLERYLAYRHSLARSLLLGLEILVAADIIRTVALEPSLASVSVLGLLVIIRIVLGWSLTVEIEGRWPWQPPQDTQVVEAKEIE